MNDAARTTPRPVDLTGIDAAHPEGESPQHLVGVAVAETAAGISGVHHLGGAGARALDAASRAIRGTSTGPGVTVSEQDGTTTIDLDLVVEYPQKVKDVVDETREQVAHAARQIVSGPVRVNITVTDVHGPFDDEKATLEGAIDSAAAAGAQAVDRAKEAGSAAAERTREVASDAADRTREIASDVADRTKEAASDARDAASDAADRAQEAGAKAVDAAKDAGAEAADRAKAAGAVIADSAKRGSDDAPQVVVVVDGPATIEVDGDEVAIEAPAGSGAPRDDAERQDHRDEQDDRDRRSEDRS